jgi:hypothetical protein
LLRPSVCGLCKRALTCLYRPLAQSTACTATARAYGCHGYSTEPGALADICSSSHIPCWHL